MPDGLLLLLAVCGAACACSRQEATQTDRPGTWYVGGLAFTQSDAATLVALDPATGGTRFLYRFEAPQGSTLLESPPQELLCAPEVGSGRVVLRYSGTIHVLDAETGRLEWQRECTRTACPSFCASLMEDGGVAIITGSGKTLTRIGPDGGETWTKPVPAGPAVDAPRAVPDGVLVRTKTALVRFDRGGGVTWSETLR